MQVGRNPKFVLKFFDGVNEHASHGKGIEVWHLSWI
jgi:hypothetical protein